MPPSESLDELLDRTRSADRSTRIELRDDVAAYGQQAIEPMVEWIDDREFAGFAVRVLERIGRNATHHALVVNALVEALPTAPSPAIARDIEDYLRGWARDSVGGDTLPRRRAANPIPP